MVRKLAYRTGAAQRTGLDFSDSLHAIPLDSRRLLNRLLCRKAAFADMPQYLGRVVFQHVYFFFRATEFASVVGETVAHEHSYWA